MAGTEDSAEKPGQREAVVAEFAAAGRGKGCPVCGRPTRTEHRPFCSRRCADVDLGRWFKGDYRVPQVEPDEGEDGAGDGDDDGRG